MARVVIENGPRLAATDDYKGYRIEVATGYDARADNWPVHVYLQRIGPDGRPVLMRELITENLRADRFDEAFDAGFALARTEIDRRES